ncbi:MAG: 16S rRNA (guanine(527)-N(7))-methyltransferase RsmG, partial [Acidobacteria bacterium]|nr:16S rRNA (guanine(527)-N(7))-methyltransferase RsmG [Acidobacteriota bacterium]
KMHAPKFGVELSAEMLKRLGDYYRIVSQWNPRLHLVAPCTAEEFATRHVLESLTALPFLSEAARVADVGSGAGLPIIPCLLARTDLIATLIEASQKKAIFLREALRLVGAGERVTIKAKRFEETPRMAVNFVTCRAIERFAEKFLELVEWSPPQAKLLFFGGPAIQEEIEKAELNYQAVLIPESERRFLFVIELHADSRR